eukprot:TRINITY_DN6951_c0_g1_i1.p2 TRINITY_DN6951_c0_g1~~TRINITY_DN6951_c0_g1_i1.p2  ORF type:complete len:132 (+),score=35.29 TRINITY_DN6951_c0_g1_i1:62-457(+)
MCLFFFFQAEDGIRDVERSRGLGDVYKRQNIIAHNADPIIKIIFLPNLSRAKVARNPKRNCETPISAVPTLAKCSPWDKSISWEQQYTAFIPVNCWNTTCLLYTSDAADDTPCVDLGGRRIIKKKNKNKQH